MKNKTMRYEEIITPYSREENIHLLDKCLRMWNQNYHTIPRIGGEFNKKGDYFIVRYCFANAEDNLGYNNYLVHTYAHVIPKDGLLCIQYIDDTEKWRKIAWKLIYPFLILCIIFLAYIIYDGVMENLICASIFAVIAAIVCALIIHFRFVWMLDISKDDLLDNFSRLILTSISPVLQTPLQITKIK